MLVCNYLIFVILLFSAKHLSCEPHATTAINKKEKFAEKNFHQDIKSYSHIKAEKRRPHIVSFKVSKNFFSPRFSVSCIITALCYASEPGCLLLLRNVFLALYMWFFFLRCFIFIRREVNGTILTSIIVYIARQLILLLRLWKVSLYFNK